MPAYISLINFTDQGIHNVKQTVERARAFKEAAKAAGGRIIGTWWTLGQYDIVVISEGPDVETAARLLIAIGMAGNVRTMTMQAFSEAEMESIVAGLP